MSVLDELKNKMNAVLGPSAANLGPELNHILDMVNDPAHGGLPGLVQKFRNQGLGALVQSWVGSGPNQPVSVVQIQQVLGDARLQALATKLGISPAAVSQKLATILPSLVDHLTPSGSLPAAPGAAPKA